MSQTRKPASRTNTSVAAKAIPKRSPVKTLKKVGTSPQSKSKQIAGKPSNSPLVNKLIYVWLALILLFLLQVVFYVWGA